MKNSAVKNSVVNNSALHSIIDMKITVRSSVTLVLPPWILKRGGLESSGRILISSNGKTKRIAFFSESSGGSLSVKDKRKKDKERKSLCLILDIGDNMKSIILYVQSLHIT